MTGRAARRRFRSRLAALALALALAAAACGREDPATTAAPVPPAAAAVPRPAVDPVVAAAAERVLAAIDANDAATFATLCADGKDARVAPVPREDVLATVQALHERWGARAHAVAATEAAADATDVLVAYPDEGASLALTMRRAPDGAWRVVGFAETASPTVPTVDEPPAATAPAAK